MQRRTFLATAISGLALACGGVTEPTFSEFDEPGRIRIRPRKPTRKTVPGTEIITFQGGRRASLRVPPTYRADEALPLIIAFHGGGGRASDFVSYPVQTDSARIVFLAPESAGSTWDAVSGAFGADIDLVNAAIAETFDRCNIDPTRIALVGFSDGGSYALTLGLSNGDNIRYTIAHSPGFFVDVPRHGHPAFFVSHGTEDQILPISDSSGLIVPRLRGFGDDVTYVQFAGGHTVPLGVQDQAITWLQRGFGRVGFEG